MPAQTLFLTGAAFLGAVALSAVGRWLGPRTGVVTGARRTPALGGLAVLTVWWVGMLATGLLSPTVMLGLLLATAIVVAVGLWDTQRALGPAVQLSAQVFAAAAVVLVSGVAVRYVTHPIGGLLRLDHWSVGALVLPGSLLALVWIVALMNIVNFLDGMDGLAAGVGAIAFLTIGVVSLLPQVADSTTALLAFTAAAALGGFLFWNLPPAALTLGTVGAWFIGFLLAVLSVQGTSKVATLAVVGAVPMLDAVAVIIGRLRRGKSPFRGDRTHLHHRLAAWGLSPRQILLLYLSASSVLGAAAVLLQTQTKIAVFVGLSVLVLALALAAPSIQRRP